MRLVDNLFDLCLLLRQVAVRFAFLEVLAHAVDRLQTVGECLRHLFVERRRGFAVVLAAFRVTQDDVTAAQGCEHRGRYFARIGAFVFGRAVLAPTSMSEPRSASMTPPRWVKGGHTMKFTQEQTWFLSARMFSANSTPSAGSVFIFQLPATIFFSHIFVFKID